MLTVVYYILWFVLPLVMAITLAFLIAFGDIIFWGAGVIVRKSVSIGRDSVIGAGWVVRRDVPNDYLVLPCEMTVHPGRVCQ